MATTATQKFIEDAIEGGWKEYETGNNTVSYYTNTVVLNKVLLDPLAWQAVGKARGWSEGEYGSTITEKYQNHWECHLHTFVHHLADGKTIEEALQAIT